MGRKSREKRATQAPRVGQAPSPVAIHDAFPPLWIAAILAGLTILIYAQVASHAFLNYDDGQFIYENDAVKTGLTGSSIGWALTSASIGWYPLTWLSHELDVTLWGLKPAGHLVTQMLLHAANAILLFVALRRMTGATIRSGFVAALFAVHPMHVESVAWASERKDTLSTLFAILALYVYAKREDSLRKQIAVAALLAASLMAKQMYVTLPFLFLVLDWWPLRRGVRVMEKIPLVALSIAASAVALIGQKNLNALQSVSALPIGARIANALDGYARYLGKLFVPTRLGVPYPMVEVATSAVAIAAILLIAITAAAWFLRDRAPYLLTGWLWFLGTLVPVIGIIQIGPQSIADRYTYFSYIGLFIALVWAAAEWIPARAAIAIGSAVVLLFTAMAWNQTRYWKDSETLFLHVIDVTGANPLAEYSLGQTLQMTAPDRAIPHLQRSIELVQQSLRDHPNVPAPDWYAQSYVAMATAKMMQARVAPLSERAPLLDSAERDLRQALKIDPTAAHAENNLKVAAVMRTQLIPGAASVNALLNEGAALSQQGKFDEAAARFGKATEVDAKSVEAWIYYGLGLLQVKRNADAVAALERAQSLDAKRANDVVTLALRRPADDANLSNLIKSIPR